MKWLIAIGLGIMGIVGLAMSMCGVLVLSNGHFEAFLMGLAMGVVPGGLLIWGAGRLWQRNFGGSPQGRDGSP